MTTATASDLTTVTEAGIRTFLDEAVRQRWTHGVVAISARPEWSGKPRLTHASDDDVAVVACGSTLAVREALLRRHETTWLVVITDRSTDDLGPEVCSYLVWQRPRRPDPWESVSRLFAATGIDRRLIALKDHRSVAHGVTAVAGGAVRLAAAPGGALTVDHLVSTVASHALGLGRPGRAPSAEDVVRWSTTPDAAPLWAAFVETGGAPLASLVRDTLARDLGPAGRAVAVLLAQSRVADLAPLGLVARVMAGPDASGVPRALFTRAAGVERESELQPVPVLSAWADATEPVVTALIRGDETGRSTAASVLSRADRALHDANGNDVAGTSRVLHAGLDQRVETFAAQLVTVTHDVDARIAQDTAAPLVAADGMGRLEELLTSVTDHVLAVGDSRLEPCAQAVRLVRWLSRPAPPASTFLEACQLHRDVDAWVDRAYDAVVRGSGDEPLAEGLAAVCRATVARRRAADRRFARLLAQHTAQGLDAPDGTLHLEDAVVRQVLPLTKSSPVLLLLADGMSLAVASEVIDSTVGAYQSWQECVPAADAARRQLGIAVLPTLTKFSRTSLFRGELADGGQREEVRGLAALAHGAPLFHKASLDRSPDGYVLSDGVSDAINDTSVPLVACVLNTVDDALDRSDAGGIVWDAASVRHLQPLLDAARRAGRVVVLTADHGHVVERGSGRSLHRPGATSNRSRPVGADLDEAEVLVRGNRVIDRAGEVVLAVDVDVRFSAKKAGYHGGASPAEVLVPLVVLTPGPAPAGWRYAPPQAPTWWREPESDTAPPAAREAPQAQPSLFVEESDRPRGEVPVLQAVLRSATWKRQTARRSTVPPERVAALLRALLLSPGRRLTRESTAAELGISAAGFEFNGAYAAVERILNVEQYPVISRTADGSVVTLDEALLREQFEVGTA